jgi:hypothetical protein
MKMTKAKPREGRRRRSSIERRRQGTHWQGMGLRLLFF